MPCEKLSFGKISLNETYPPSNCSSINNHSKCSFHSFQSKLSKADFQNDSSIESISFQTDSKAQEDIKDEELPLSLLEKQVDQMKNNDDVKADIECGRRIGFYQLRSKLGSGNFSCVKFGIHTLTGERVAVKILDKKQMDLKTKRLLSREVSNMELLRHPSIIRLYEVIETPTSLHLILEYAPGGELYTRIIDCGRFSECSARPLFWQILSGVQYLHSFNIIHRDIKAENILFVIPTVVKLADFGFSIHAQANQQLTTFCGSPPYAAPELFCEKFYTGPQVDVWALGVLLYFIVTGKMPFTGENLPMLREKIIKCAYQMPFSLSSSCQNLIRQILVSEPKSRLNLTNMMRSTWMSEMRTSLNKAQELDAIERHEFYHTDPLQTYQHSAADCADPVEETSGSSNSGEEDSNKQLTIYRETHRILKELGIKEKHLLSAEGCGARSCINGTYRIVLHLVQKRESILHRCFCHNNLLLNRSRNDLTQSINRGNNRTLTVPAIPHDRGSTQKTKDSKMCHIL